MVLIDVQTDGHMHARMMSMVLLLIKDSSVAARPPLGQR